MAKPLRRARVLIFILIDGFLSQAQCNTTHEHTQSVLPSISFYWGLSKSSLLNNFHSSYYYQAGSISISESLQKIYCLTTKVLVSRTLTVTSKCELYEELICSLEFHTILVGSYLFFCETWLTNSWNIVLSLSRNPKVYLLPYGNIMPDNFLHATFC